METRNPKQILWYGALPSIEECAARCDVDAVKDIVDLQAYLKDTVKSKTVYVLHKDQRPNKLKWEDLSHSMDLNASYLKPAMDM